MTDDRSPIDREGKAMDNRAFSRWLCIVILLGGAVFSSPVGYPAAQRDWIITATHPNLVYVLDGSTDEIIREIPLEGPGTPFQIAVSARQKTAYVITNRWESIAIVDLNAGREVGHIELSGGSEKVKAISIAVTPAGDRLYIYEIPTQWEIDRVKAAQPRLHEIELPSKKSLRRIPMPRQVMLLAMAPDGQTLYAVAQDIYVVDLRKGAVIRSIPLKHVNITGLGEPDIFIFWPNYEQSSILSIIYSDQPRLKPDSPLLGLINLDLTSGMTEWIELEALHRVIFNSVVSPTRRRAYLVFNTLTEVNLDEKRVERVVELEHTYYTINISSDGQKLYLGGAQPDLAVYEASTLRPIKKIKLKGDQAIASLKILRMDSQ